jgi:outer membrane protein
VLLLGLAAALLPDWSAAAELLGAFELALQNDRSYLNAQAEEKLGQLDARRAGLSYLPTIYMEQGRSAFEKSDRTTIQAIQPLLDFDKYTSLQEAPVKAAYAQATLGVREIELAKRVFAAYSSLVRSNALRHLALLESQSLERQVLRAQRRFDLGYASVMDMSLAQVQYAQAMARYQSLQNDIQLAQQKLFSLTGATYRNLQSQPADDVTPALLQEEKAVGGEQELEHPQITQAKELVQLAELGVTRSKSSFLPQLNLIVRNSQYAGMTDDYQGLQLSFPSGVSMYGLQAGQRAQVDLERAQRALEEVQEQLRLERESTDLALKVNAQELVFRSNAEKVSEQNVASTERAYESGIVKASDVVNAILAKFEVQRQKLQLHMSMAEQRLFNSLNRGASAKKSLEEVSRFFSE